MVCWMLTRFAETFDFYTYDIFKGLQHHIIPNTVGMKYGEKYVELNTAAMWEMRPDEFCFVTHSSRTRPEGEIINNNYIVNVGDRSIREANFLF